MAISLLGVSLARSHHHRVLGDAQVRLPQAVVRSEAHFARASSCHRTVGQVGAGGSDILSDRTGSVGERAAKHEACDVRILS